MVTGVGRNNPRRGNSVSAQPRTPYSQSNNRVNFDHRSLLSGHRKGVVAGAARALLRIAEIPYGIVVRRRNRKFDAGHDVCSVDVPVISVGNLTTGGTGKTPVVCYLAKWLREHDVRVAIVSRGYGRGDRDENDEALELHARLPDVPHVHDPDRVAGATLAVEEFESQLILLDDAFQHRRLRRDLDIVVVDATCPFGYGHLLPRGLLREPISSLSRASLVIMTRVSCVAPTAITTIEQAIHRYHPECPIALADHQSQYLLEFPRTELPIEQLRGQRVAVVCAIGNPQAFEESLMACGAVVVAAHHLPDHDSFSPQIVTGLKDWVRSLGDTIDRVVCTHKDLVKLEMDRLGGKPLQAVVIDLVICRGDELVVEQLERIRSMVDIGDVGQEWPSE